MIQVSLSILIMIEAVENYGSKSKFKISAWQATWIMMARFLCGIVMHINLADRVNQGMRMMKYSLNHQWKFENWTYGFFAGLMQFLAAFCVEIGNFISILTHFEIMDIVMKFMSLLIIQSFGQIFYAAYEEADWKKVITHNDYANFFVIQTTTSR